MTDLNISQEERISDEAIRAAVEVSGSQRKAAALVGLSHQALGRRLKRMALKGYSPEHDLTKLVPEGFKVKGYSNYYDKDGKLTGQWVKTDQDRETVQKMMEAAIAGISADLPRAKPTKIPATELNSDLVNTYVITDYHLGMLSWGEETGADWDLSIAEEMLVSWFKLAIEQSPRAEKAVLAQLGDFLHFDSFEPVTPMHKHLLDADTRFQKLIRVAIRALRRIIEMLLAKYDHVHVLMAEGNHDITSSMWLREWMAAHYENEPLITKTSRALRLRYLRTHTIATSMAIRLSSSTMDIRSE